MMGARSAVRRRGMLLPVTLVIVALLVLLSSSFAFMVRAHLGAVRAAEERLQARLAAEAGLQRVLLFLRTNRDDPASWRSNNEVFRKQVVWTEGMDLTSLPEAARIEPGTPTWYYSVVADDVLNDEYPSLRYGLDDEAGKVNLNGPIDDPTYRSILVRLFAQFVPTGVDPESLVDALFDWRDSDDEPRPGGAETEIYAQREPPIRAKNADLDTVEELLLIEGFTPQILYGEDLNRNGILDPNEDDGEAALPVDNGDGRLNRGLYPYVTVFSRGFELKRDETGQGDSSDSSGDQPDGGGSAPGDSQAEQGEGGSGDSSTGNGGAGVPRVVETHQRINVMTAAPPVLRALGFDEDAVMRILEVRGTLEEGERRDAGWLVSHGLVDAATYDQIKDYLTTTTQQYHAEIIGFAEHTGTYYRLEVVFEMLTDVPQILYRRDLTPLGMGYPVRDDGLDLGEEGVQP